MMLMVNNPMANPKLVEAWSFQSGFVARCDSSHHHHHHHQMSNTVASEGGFASKLFGPRCQVTSSPVFPSCLFLACGFYIVGSWLHGWGFLPVFIVHKCIQHGDQAGENPRYT